jgi:ATP-binding cassette subfamily A (ABC1) protein 3
VASTKKEDMKVRIHKLKKVYTAFCRRPFLAVERISFGLDYGECFCLLGVNGAGKTTCFKSLTNDILPNSGEISINGLDVSSQFNKVRKIIGFCPQHNATFDLLTVEEHLDYYAKLKGISNPNQRLKLVN